MSKTDCFSQTKEIYKYLDKERSEELEEAIVALLNANKDTPIEGYLAEARDLLVRESENMKQLSTQKIRDAIKKKAIHDDIRAGAIDPKDIKTVKDAKKYIDTLLNNFLEKLEGHGSIDALSRAETSLLSNAQYSALIKEELFEHWASGELDPLIREELHRRGTGKRPISQDKPEGWSDDQIMKASRIVDISKKTSNLMLHNQRSAGLNIKERKDWLAKHTYSKVKLKSMGKANFIDLVKNHVDQEGSFTKAAINKNELDSVIGKVYDDILEMRDMVKSDQPLRGSLSMLKERKFNFKSGFDEDEFFKSVSDYDTLAEAFDVNLQQAGTTYASVKTLGANSEANFNALASDLNKHLREVTTGKFSEAETNALVKRYEGKLNTLKDSFKVVVANPYTPKGAATNIANVLRNLNSMSKLGSSLFTSLYDANAIALQYALATGENQFKALYRTTVEVLATRYGKEGRKELGKQLNVMTYLHDPALAMGGNKGDFKTGYDRFNRFASNVYRLTGVPFQTEISRNVGAMLQARAIKKFVEDFKGGTFNAAQKLKMERYKITEGDIDILSNISPSKDMPDVITPLDVLDIPLEKFHANESVAYKLRRDLFDKVGMWVDDAVQAGTPTPTARTKRILRKGENIEDEDLRAVMSVVMQFKETAAKIVDDNIRAYRDYNKINGGGLGGNAATVGQVGLYGLNAMVTYMLIENARALITGSDTPMERFKKKGGRALFVDYVNKASFLPVLTDFAGGATDKYWRSAVPNAILGPTFSMGTDMLQFGHKPNKKNFFKAANHFLPPPLSKSWFPRKMIERQILGVDFYTGQKIRK